MLAPKNNFFGIISNFKHEILFAIVLQLTLSLTFYQKEIPFLPEGPNYQIAMSAKSILETGSLESEEHRKQFIQLHRLAKKSGLAYWQDMFALAKDGKLIQAHSLFTSLVLIPFYLLFGNFGFWLFNQACFIITITALLSLFESYTTKSPTVIDLLIIFLGPVSFHAYGLSYDLFGTCLIVAGIALGARKFHKCSGFFIGLSIFIRPTNALYAILLTPLNRFEFKNKSKALISFVVVVIIYLFFNYFFFGSILTTSRSRMPFFEADQISFYNPHLDFQLLLRNWRGKLFNLHAGLLTYAPFLTAIPIVYLLTVLAKDKSEKLKKTFLHYQLTLFNFIVQALIIFSFHCWSCSNFGNRYLMPVTMLLFVETLALIHIRYPKFSLSLKSKLKAK